MEERLDHVVEVSRTELLKHLEFSLFDLLKHVFLVVRLVEGKRLLPTGSLPRLNPHDRVNKVIVCATIKPSQRLKALWEQDLDGKLNHRRFKLLCDADYALLLLCADHFGWGLEPKQTSAAIEQRRGLLLHHCLFVKSGLTAVVLGFDQLRFITTRLNNRRV